MLDVWSWWALWLMLVHNKRQNQDLDNCMQKSFQITNFYFLFYLCVSFSLPFHHPLDVSWKSHNVWKALLQLECGAFNPLNSHYKKPPLPCFGISQSLLSRTSSIVVSKIKRTFCRRPCLARKDALNSDTQGKSRLTLTRFCAGTRTRSNTGTIYNTGGKI